MFEMMYEMIMKVYEVLVEFLGVVMICIFSVIGNFSEMGMDFIGNVVFDMPEPQEVTENKYVDYSDLKDNVLEYSNFEIYKNWSEASLKDKEVFIEAVKNRELSELGVTYEISIKYKELGNTLGQYVTNDKIIDLNRKHVEEADVLEVIGTVAHECYHAYQIQCVEMYKSLDEADKDLEMFSDVVKYGKEFENYILANEDFGEYYLQNVEIDARTYAENRVLDYRYNYGDYVKAYVHR